MKFQNVSIETLNVISLQTKLSQNSSCDRNRKNRHFDNENQNLHFVRILLCQNQWMWYIELFDKTFCEFWTHHTESKTWSSRSDLGETIYIPKHFLSRKLWIQVSDMLFEFIAKPKIQNNVQINLKKTKSKSLTRTIGGKPSTYFRPRAFFYGRLAIIDLKKLRERSKSRYRANENITCQQISWSPGFSKEKNTYLWNLWTCNAGFIITLKTDHQIFKKKNTLQKTNVTIFQDSLANRAQLDKLVVKCRKNRQPFTPLCTLWLRSCAATHNSLTLLPHGA